MITWLRTGEIWEGLFKSSFFCNEDKERDLFVYIEDASAESYAEKCIEIFNSLSNSVIEKICEGLFECAKEGGINDDFELPKNITDILDYCWFTTVYVSIPNDENDISFIVEGEGEWGEAIGFVIENGQLAYVGVDYFDY